MNLRLVTLSLTLLTILIFSCGDENKVSLKTEMISRTWKISTWTLNGSDYLVNLKECDKDNTFTYYKDGTYKHEEGATKCNSGEPQLIEAATWTFLEKETKLKIIYTDSDPVTYDILDLTSDVLKLSIPDPNLVFEVTFTPR